MSKNDYTTLVRPIEWTCSLNLLSTKAFVKASAIIEYVPMCLIDNFWNWTLYLTIWYSNLICFDLLEHLLFLEKKIITELSQYILIDSMMESTILRPKIKFYNQISY